MGGQWLVYTKVGINYTSLQYEAVEASVKKLWIVEGPLNIF